MSTHRHLLLLTTLGLATIAACKGKEAKVEATPVDLVKRGEVLVKIGGCADCHTPVAFDEKLGAPMPMPGRYLSGHPEGAPVASATPGKGDQAVFGPTMTSFKLPFGTVYTANLTPDKETGLGSWNKEMFIRAVKTGKHRGEANGRPILPPMPWNNLAVQSDADLEAIFAYLQTIPAVKNKVPEPEVPPPVMEAVGKTNEKVAALPK